MEKIPVILHLDLDCFYAQVESIRLNIDQKEPLALQQWGSLLAVNYASRPYKVQRGDSIKVARQKCPEIHLVLGILLYVLNKIVAACGSAWRKREPSAGHYETKSVFEEISNGE